MKIINTYRVQPLVAALMMALLGMVGATSNANAHCGFYTVNLHGIPCRIVVCAHTPNGRYCDTVTNGTTQVPVVGGLQISSVSIQTQNGPVVVPQGGCVDNIRVVPGCCVKVCVTTDPITGCTIVNITPASNPC